MLCMHSFRFIVYKIHMTILLCVVVHIALSYIQNHAQTHSRNNTHILEHIHILVILKTTEMSALLQRNVYHI